MPWQGILGAARLVNGRDVSSVLPLPVSTLSLSSCRSLKEECSSFLCAELMVNQYIQEDGTVKTLMGQGLESASADSALGPQDTPWIDKSLTFLSSLCNHLFRLRTLRLIPA